MSEFHCVLPVQLRFSDIDTVGHVNNSVYFSLFDVAKSDYFDKVRGEKQDWRNVTIVIANVNCDFLAQTLYEEPVVVKTRCAKIGNKSLVLEQVLVNEATGEVKCRCHTTMVYIEPKTLTPEPLPDYWREALERFEQQ